MRVCVAAHYFYELHTLFNLDEANVLNIYGYQFGMILYMKIPIMKPLTKQI